MSIHRAWEGENSNSRRLKVSLAANRKCEALGDCSKLIKSLSNSALDTSIWDDKPVPIWGESKDLEYKLLK